MFTFDLTQKVSGEKTINAKVAISRNGKYGLTAFSEKTAEDFSVDQRDALL